MEKIKNVVKGYKVTNPDYTCRDFKYEIGKTYKEDKMSLCNCGFHFCRKIADCFNYYEFDCANKVLEVEALGIVEDSDNKSVTNIIKIIREISWEEMLTLGNVGKGNNGLRNTGYRNTGYSNTGDWNTGYRNTGDWNTGYSNTGDWNTGYSNTGDWNTGYRNTGDWNKTDNSSGCFNTRKQEIYMFNKKSNWTLNQFRESTAFRILNKVEKSIWVYTENMTDKEKADNPQYETCGGYLKEIPRAEASLNWWKSLSKFEKQEIYNLPNFDKKIFCEIMELDEDVVKIKK